MESLDATPRYRYPGVKPFTTQEQDLFFGRDKDIDDLFSLIFVKQAVVLYGKSGYGKSSLISAGIIPKLKTNTQFVYFPIRFNNYSEKQQAGIISPTDTVRQRLNIDLQSETATPSPLDTLIEQEGSLWYWIKTYQWQRQQTQFILFFDQFEELFTYPKKQISEFSEQLSQLLYPSIPLQYRQRMVELDDTNILDDASQDFLYQRPDIKVVFSVRSDRLSLLNSLTDHHPAILQNCYELEALSRVQAREAITIPAGLTQAIRFRSPKFTYADDAVDAILDEIANPQDGKIETATLQIVCRYVEETLVKDQPNVLITPEKLGDVADIFRQYYEGVLDRLNSNDRLKTQRLIEDELIESGRRNTLTENYIQNRFGFAPDLLQTLEQTSLLRKERDAAGRLLYEISHDTLVEAIEKVADTRRAEEEEAKQKTRKLEEETRKKKLEQDLADERARAENLQRLTNRAVFRSRLAIAFATAAFLIALLALYYWKDAQTQKQSAEKATLKAQKAQERAEVEKKNATESAKYLSAALDRVNLQKAVVLQETGQRYEEYDEFTLALQAYQQAESMVKSIKDPNISLSTNLRLRPPRRTIQTMMEIKRQANLPQNTRTNHVILKADLQRLKDELAIRIAYCRKKLEK